MLNHYLVLCVNCDIEKQSCGNANIKELPKSISMLDAFI